MFKAPPVYIPPAAANPATPADSKIQAAGANVRQNGSLMGFGSTINTSAAGLSNNTPTAGKQLTGQ